MKLGIQIAEGEKGIMKSVQGFFAPAGIIGRSALLIVALAMVVNLGGCRRKKVTNDMNASTTANEMAQRMPANNAGSAPDVEHPVIGSLEPISEMQVVYFDYNKSDIRKDQFTRVEGDLKYLKDHPDIRCMVTGNCDERGSTEYNLALGERRAQQVLKYFVENGIPAARLQAQSMGEEQPADSGHDESGWAKNRRAEFARIR